MKKRGFTLIELVVVMALIAVLALMVIGAVIAARRMTTETKHRNNAKAIQVGLEKSYASTRTYPTYNDANIQTVADDLNISIDATTECAAGTALGGGKVTSGGQTFSVRPYDYECVGTMGNPVEEYKNPQ